MKTKKVSQIDVFSGAPWEVEMIKNLLHAANVNAKVVDDMEMKISVPCECYTTAMQVIGSRI
ncbi:DUF2007-related protein [Bacteroides sedimenti]|uniref:DUF2007 domain-containing protein n=1 Tax=Bacteroides sedimenti TaxID=2136147 RepID=A0ABN6Z6W9_9BACE